MHRINLLQFPLKLNLPKCLPQTIKLNIVNCIPDSTYNYPAKNVYGINCRFIAEWIRRHLWLHYTLPRILVPLLPTSAVIGVTAHWRSLILWKAVFTISLMCTLRSYFLLLNFFSPSRCCFFIGLFFVL